MATRQIKTSIACKFSKKNHYLEVLSGWLWRLLFSMTSTETLTIFWTLFQKYPLFCIEKVIELTIYLSSSDWNVLPKYYPKKTMKRREDFAEISDQSGLPEAQGLWLGRKWTLLCLAVALATTESSAWLGTSRPRQKELCNRKDSKPSWGKGKKKRASSRKRNIPETPFHPKMDSHFIFC